MEDCVGELHHGLLVRDASVLKNLMEELTAQMVLSSLWRFLEFHFEKLGLKKEGLEVLRISEKFEDSFRQQNAAVGLLIEVAVYILLL